MPRVNRLLGGLLGAANIALAACAPDHFVPLNPGPVAPLASFAHRAASPDVELFWNCTHPRPEVMRLDGAARNSGKREARSMELTVRSLRAGDAPLPQTATAIPEIMLYASGPSPFQVDLPLEKGSSRIDVSAVYRVTPDVGAPSSAGPQETLAAEDACSPSKHPNPLNRQ